MSTDMSTSSDLPIKCSACSSEIALLSKAKPDDVVVNAGGTILSMSEDLYQGVICETCRKMWCSGCWVTMMIDDNDICPTCGVRLVPLTSRHFKL
jgi:hypothetical protein